MNGEIDIRTPMEGQLGCYVETFEIKLENKKKNLEKQLQEVNEAIKLFNENPKILDILNALRKVGI